MGETEDVDGSGGRGGSDNNKALSRHSATSHVCDPYYLNTPHVGPPYRHLVENTSHLYVQ